MKKETKMPMPKKASKVKKKKYYGVVISPFNTMSTTYNVGDKFETNHKGSLEYLINKKIVK